MTDESRGGGILGWQRRMFDELAATPEIMASLRETAANLKTVSDRLVLVTEALERTTRAAEESGLLTIMRRLDDASSSLRKAVGATVEGDVSSAIAQTRAVLDDVRSRIETMASRILAGPPPLDGDEEDDEHDEDDGS